MWNLNDDSELDKLSRDAAENYALDQSPDSWSKLHARLDAEMPEKKRRRYLLFFLLALVIGSGGFWVSRINSVDAGEQAIAQEKSHLLKSSDANNQQTVSPTQAENANSSSQSSTKPSSSTVQGELSEKPEAGRKVQVEGAPNGEKLEITRGGKTSNTPTSIRDDRTQIKSTQKNKPGQTSLLIAGNKKKNKTRDDKAKDNISAGSEGVSDQESTENSTDASSSPRDVASAPKKDEATTQSVDEKDKKQEPVVEPKKSDPVEKQTPTKDNIRWTFGAVYAPDISTVHFTHSQPLGLNIGLSVDYRINQKFSLQTAFIYTKKNYKLNGEDYHPSDPWFPNVKMIDVTGSCSMYDIPLNVRYNAVRKKTWDIFFSTGLSSYLMKKEEYTYNYLYNGMPGTRHRIYSTTDDYLFSILNVSAGIEKSLNRSFSLQVEPFFKQTLTGVGYGSISLSSAGVYFSLRYSPLKPAKK